MTARSYRPRDLMDAAAGSLDLSAHGIFWAGVERMATPEGTFARGQACVEFFVPRSMTQAVPIVLVHGGGQSTDYLGTADGAPGWVHRLVEYGFAVYLIDLPGHGRAPGHSIQIGDTYPPMGYEQAEALFTAPEANPSAWPQAALHSQWPQGSNALDAFVASSGPVRSDQASAQSDGARALCDLLDRIGPAMVLTHSAGAPVGWLAADRRPALVNAIIAVEPLGPPVTGMGPMTLPWGLTAAPLTYDPPIASPDELNFVERTPDGPGLMPCLVQAEPARQLPHLSQIPIAVVTAEASWMAMDNHGTVDFLRQAGAQVDHIRLEAENIHGNGHLPMMERNADAVLHRIAQWIAGMVVTA